MIKRIKIGTGSCGIAAGAEEVFEYFKENIKDIDIVEVGCIGHCYAEPIIEVETENESIFYERVEPNQDFVNNILNLGDESRLSFNQKRTAKEKLKVTKFAGRIVPTSMEEYKENGGYDGLKKALTMQSYDVVEEVKRSGLRGRGGGGFPTGLKWSLLANKEAEEKVLICNADEGDPGAFMDRSLMESVPHQVLEGMLIAACNRRYPDIYLLPGGISAGNS